MTNALLHPWPAFSDEEADAVAAVLRSNRVNYWTGQECREFEREFANWSGSNHAIALANGTLALDLALQALGIGPGDEVIVTPRTFIASASCVVNAGATPVFADVDGDSGNISPATIAAVMTDRTRAIIPVHLGGWPCDMDGIMALAAPRNIAVIEDCAQAHGARVGDRSVGSIGHVGAWSFCQDKIMTTGGEGGMVTSDDEQLWRKMWSFKDHGKDWDAVYTRAHAPGFRWVHESIGTNWRMLEMQAVLGRIQLTRMEGWTAQRTANAMAYHTALTPHQDILHLPLAPAGFTHAFYRHYVYVRPEALADGWDRDRIVAEMQAAGIPVMHGTCSEVYLEKAFDGTPWRPAQRLPTAQRLGETSIMFLVQPTIDTQAAERYAALAASVMAKAKA